MTSLPTEPDAAHHDVELLADMAGCYVAECSCGWETPPCTKQAIAMCLWNEHSGEQ